jgi:hypothetical protein
VSPQATGRTGNPYLTPTQSPAAPDSMLTPISPITEPQLMPSLPSPPCSGASPRRPEATGKQQ